MIYVKNTIFDNLWKNEVASVLYISIGILQLQLRRCFGLRRSLQHSKTFSCHSAHLHGNVVIERFFEAFLPERQQPQNVKNLSCEIPFLRITSYDH